MLIKNCTVNWAFISQPDESGKYRLSFSPNNKEDVDKIVEELQKPLTARGIKTEPDWFGSRKINEDGRVWFGAKSNSSFVNKKGETVEVQMKVYDSKARQYGKDLNEPIPMIANGAICNLSVSSYYVEYKKKMGVMLNLDGVQLIKYDVFQGANPFKDESQDKDEEFSNEDSLNNNQAQDYFS